MMNINANVALPQLMGQVSNANPAPPFDYQAAYSESIANPGTHHVDDINTKAAVDTANVMQQGLSMLIRNGDNESVKDALSDSAACWLMRNFGSDTHSPIGAALQERNFDVLPELLNKTATAKNLDLNIDNQHLPMIAVSTGEPEVVQMFMDAAMKTGDNQIVNLFKPGISAETGFGKALENCADKSRGYGQNRKDYAILRSLCVESQSFISNPANNLIFNAIDAGCDGDVIKQLMEFGTSIFLEDNNGASLMMRAASSANASALEYLVTKSVDHLSEEARKGRLYSEKSPTHQSLLLAVVDNKSKSKAEIAECVYVLLRARVDIDFRPEGGVPALFEAIRNGNEAVVKLLCDNWVNTKYTDSNYNTYYAKDEIRKYAENNREYLPTARLLLDSDEVKSIERKLDVREATAMIDKYIGSNAQSFPPISELRAVLKNIQDRGLLNDVLKDNPILYKAALKAPGEGIAAVIDFIPKDMITARGPDDRTALHVAVDKNNFDDIKALSTENAAPPPKVEQSYVARAFGALAGIFNSIGRILGLTSAESNKSTTLIIQPTMSIIGVNAKDGNGNTALVNALQHGRYEAAELLLQAGATFEDSDLRFLPDSNIRAAAVELVKKYGYDPYAARA